MRNVRRKYTPKICMYMRVGNKNQLTIEEKSKQIPTFSPQYYHVTKTIGPLKLKYKSVGLNK